MKKLLPVVFSGVLAVSFSQLAAAQVSVQGPAGTGANVDLNKGPNVNASPDVQNSQQVGQGNQANQQQGTGNQAQNSQQSGGQSENSQQYGQSSSSQRQSPGAGATSGSQGAEDKNPNSPRTGCAKGKEPRRQGGQDAARVPRD